MWQGFEHNWIYLAFLNLWWLELIEASALNLSCRMSQSTRCLGSFVPLVHAHPRSFAGSLWVQLSPVCLSFGLYLIGGTRSTNSVTLVFDCFPKSSANKSIGFLDSRWWAITPHLAISEARNFPTNVLSLHPCAMIKLNWGVYPVDLHLWKKRNERLKSLCCAVENVDGAKNLIGFCLGRQSWAFLSDSAVHTITSNRLHWLEIHSSAPNLHVILSKNKLQHKEKCKPVDSRKVLARQ